MAYSAIKGAWCYTILYVRLTTFSEFPFPFPLSGHVFRAICPTLASSDVPTRNIFTTVINSGFIEESQPILGGSNSTVLTGITVFT